MSINQPPYGEDLRKLGAIASLLKVSAQDSPNMTVRVSQGGFWKNETTWVETPAINTTTLSAPGSGMRYTLICLNNNASLSVVTGTAVLSNPVLPAVPAGACPLAAILITAGTTSIKNDMIYDLRPFFRAGAASVVHNDASGRSTADAHPMSAITGLTAALADKIDNATLTSAIQNKADITGTSDDTFILRQGYVGSPAGNVVLEVERGSSTNVGLRWNETGLTWEYTNDGATWNAFSTPVLLPNSIAYANLDAGLQSSVDDIAGKADAVHTHVAADVTDFIAAAKAATVADAINNGTLDIAPSQNAVYDALVAKADTVHTHVAADVTDFTTASRSAAVADAITDGVTNIAPSQNAVFDALALKAASTHTHVAADTTDFDAAAQAAAVAQTITNGVTTSAPSQDAVFDALALKAAASHTHVATDVTDFTTAAQAAAVAQTITNGVTTSAPSQDAVFDALALKAASTHTHVAADVTDFTAAAKAATVADAIADSVTDVAPSQNAVFDALAGKSNTGHTHTAANVTDFTTAAQAAAVAQTITNGVTATAPSQDVVFDALALKSDTSHTHVAANITDFTAAAKAATVADAIADSVTDVAPSQNAVFDALALKAASTHTHVAADVTDFTTAAQAAAVAQTITNGVTTSAPSQDAVYDALVLKQDALGASLSLVGQAVAPAAPAAGNYILYVLSGDGKLYIKDSADVATVVGTQA